MDGTAGPGPAVGVGARAGLVVRALALVLDTAVVSAIQVVLGAVYGVTRVTGGSPPPAGAGFAAFTTTTALDWLALGAVLLVYFGGFELVFGCTPGKYLLWLRVASASGGRASWRAIVVRNLLRLVDGLPLLYLLGGLVVLGTPRHQRLGDLLAGTVVVDRRDAPAGSRVGLKLGALALLVAAGAGISLAFSYLGRPPLVIEGLRNTGEPPFAFVQGPVAGYDLGAPAWGSDTVTYPITYHLASGADCHGTVSLRWQGFWTGWQLSGGTTTCP